MGGRHRTHYTTALYPAALWPAPPLLFRGKRETPYHEIQRANIYRKTKGQQCSLFIINCSFGRCKTYVRLCILTRSYVLPATFPRLGNVADNQLVSYLCHKAFVDSGGAFVFSVLIKIYCLYHLQVDLLLGDWIWRHMMRPIICLRKKKPAYRNCSFRKIEGVKKAMLKKLLLCSSGCLLLNRKVSWKYNMCAQGNKVSCAGGEAHRSTTAKLLYRSKKGVVNRSGHREEQSFETLIVLKNAFAGILPE